MSKSDQFWQYAREATLSAYYAKTNEVKLGLLELARTWTQAALQERASSRSIRVSSAGPGLRQIASSKVELIWFNVIGRSPSRALSHSGQHE